MVAVGRVGWAAVWCSTRSGALAPGRRTTSRIAIRWTRVLLLLWGSPATGRASRPCSPRPRG